MELIIDVRGQNACTLWAFYPLIFSDKNYNKFLSAISFEI